MEKRRSSSRRVREERTEELLLQPLKKKSLVGWAHPCLHSYPVEIPRFYGILSTLPLPKRCDSPLLATTATIAGPDWLRFGGPGLVLAPCTAGDTL